MAQGEMLVGTKPSGYAIRSKNGGPNYTTKDGGFASAADAQTAGKELEAIVGTDFEVVPNVLVVVQGRRGRKPGTDKVVEQTGTDKVVEQKPGSNADPGALATPRAAATPKAQTPASAAKS